MGDLQMEDAFCALESALASLAKQVAANVGQALPEVEDPSDTTLGLQLHIEDLEFELRHLAYFREKEQKLEIEAVDWLSRHFNESLEDVGSGLREKESFLVAKMEAIISFMDSLEIIDSASVSACCLMDSKSPLIVVTSRFRIGFDRKLDGFDRFLDIIALYRRWVRLYVYFYKFVVFTRLIPPKILFK
jgi:hypothetical protein